MSVLVWAITASGGQAATFDELANGAAAARRSNQMAQAVELYRQALDLRPEWPEGWWFLGTLSYSLYRYSDCEGAFTRFVKMDEKRALGWALLGLCEFETGNYDSARTHIERGLAPGSELPPEIEAGVRFHDGLLLTRAGLFDQGRRELEHFARGGAAEPMLIAGMGLNALRQPLLPKDIPADRQDLTAKAGRTLSAWILGEMAKAEDGFRELLHDYPAAPGVHFLYGSFLSTVRPEEAKAEFRRELELNPESADARVMLALLLLPDDPGAALSQAEKAALQKPGDALAQCAFGKALLGTGKLAAGTERLETAERLDPGGLETHLALAGAYAKAGRDDDARRERRISMSLAKGQNGTD